MENLKLSEVKKQFLDSLKPLEELGYKVNKSDFSLVKKEKDRVLKLSFTENHYDNEIQIIPSVKIQIKEFDKIINMPNEFIDYSAIINLRKLFFWDNNLYWDDYSLDTPLWFSIYKYEDIIKISEEIRRLFIDYGVKYISKYGSAEGINKLLNSDPKNEASSNYHPKESAWWHCPGFHVQSIVGLIAAKYAKNGESYEYISKIYTDRINEHIKNDTMSQFHTNRFFEIKKHLDI